VVAPNGTVVAVWVAQVNGANLARGSVRLPGQAFGPVVTLTPTDGRNAANIQVAMDAAGNATAAWQEENGPGGVLQIRATRFPAGSQAAEPPQTVSAPGAISTLPVIGVGANGVAVIAYSEGPVMGGMQFVRAVTRTGPGGDFGGLTTLSGPFNSTDPNTVVGVDDAGGAVVAWQRLNGATNFIEANDKPPGGAFGNETTTQTISNTLINSTGPALGMAPDGTTVVLWSETGPIVGYNERTPAGTWLPDRKVASPPAQTASSPVVGMDGGGNAIAVWRATIGATNFLQAALRPAGGTFGSYTDLTSTDGVNLDIAVNRGGDSVLTFTSSMADIVGSIVRPRGGAFSGVLVADREPRINDAVFNQGVGIDDEGNAAGIFTRNIVNPGNSWEVATGLLDAAPPTLSATVPPGGTARQPIGMAAAAVDRLTPVSIGWTFGDGGTASGGAVSHVFGTPGAFNVTVTATDGVGNARTTTRPILVRAAPAKRITSPVRVAWGVSKKRLYLLKMSVVRVPKGAKAELRCAKRKSGKKCPFKLKSSKRIRKNAITLFKQVKVSKVAKKKQRMFRAGQRLVLRITAPGYVGKAVRYDLRKSKIPSGKTFCMRVGSKKLRKRC
jgi:PKD domain